MPATHTIWSQCNMMYATWHLACGVFIDLEMGMDVAPFSWWYTTCTSLRIESLMRLLNASHLWRGVAFLHTPQKGAEQAQGTYGKNEYEPQRVVDVKVVNCSWSLCSHKVGGNSVANLWLVFLLDGPSSSAPLECDCLHSGEAVHFASRASADGTVLSWCFERLDGQSDWEFKA